MSEVVKECKDSNYSKTKTYALATRDNINVLRLSASSSKEYDAHIGEFDRSIASLQVCKALDVKTAIRTMSGMQSVQGKVTASTAQVTVKIDTTSNVGNIEFLKNALSFDVSCKKDTKGVSEVSIGFMKGPFKVRIDSKQTGDFKVTQDRTTRETLLSVNYGRDAKHRGAIPKYYRFCTISFRCSGSSGSSPMALSLFWMMSGPILRTRWVAIRVSITLSTSFVDSTSLSLSFSVASRSYLAIAYCKSTSLSSCESDMDAATP